MEPNILSVLLGIIGLPLQLMHATIWGFLNFMVFDLFQLGPFLPIEF